MTIRLYTTKTCPYCHAAKSLLKQRNLAFEEIDVTGDTAIRAELIEKTGLRTVPQIFINDRSVGGFQELRQFFEESA